MKRIRDISYHALSTTTRVSFLVALAACTFVARTEAVIALNSPTSDFNPLTLNGPSDPIADNQANRPDIELVGDDALGFFAFYTQFQDNLTDPDVSNTDGELFFRIRVAGENGSPDGEANGFFLVGLDVSGNGAIDYFINHGGNPSQQIRILKAGSSTDNDSPNSLSLGAQLGDAIDVTSSNSLFTEVTNIDTLNTTETFTRTDPNNPSKQITITRDNLDGGRLTDMFLTFSLSFEELALRINDDLGPGEPEFNDQSTYRLLLVTSQNGNNINSDLGGVDGFNDTRFEDEDGGGLTNPVDVTGTEVPEPSAYSLLLGLYALAFVWLRRRV